MLKCALHKELYTSRLESKRTCIQVLNPNQYNCYLPIMKYSKSFGFHFYLFFNCQSIVKHWSQQLTFLISFSSWLLLCSSQVQKSASRIPIIFLKLGALKVTKGKPCGFFFFFFFFEKTHVGFTRHSSVLLNNNWCQHSATNTFDNFNAYLTLMNKFEISILM
jgi:hypothetical protein